MRGAPGRLVVEDEAEVFVLHRSHFADLERECHELTAALVHEMIDRSRSHQMAELHEDRLQSLGRLAAGLAHELNNPASAASRSALSLAGLLDAAEQGARTLAQARLTDEQLEVVDAVRAACAAAVSSRGAIELAEREDQFADWLERHGVDSIGADVLATSELSTADLDRFASVLEPSSLGAAIQWVTRGRAARDVAAHVAAAAGRIHGLVDAVKRFTLMDRESVPGEIDVAQGLADTLTMLGTKARTRAVEVRLEAAPDLPRIHGFGSEINQVWERLIDNAIDAAGRDGHVSVSAAVRGEDVVVLVADDGPGIPKKHRARIFEPFFTTKPVGQATGLGLHLARRFVVFHHGDVDFTSEPGRTVFRVRLPISYSSP
jgi:signal transduction histidine kinase